MLEQRKHPRFRLRHTKARSDEFEADVLDLSRSGMRIAHSRPLGVDKAMFFELNDRRHSLEVTGRVRWSRPGATTDDGPDHHAGVQFMRLISSDANGVWARLVAESGEPGKPVGHAAAGTAGASRIPLLTILAPEDGTVTRKEAVTVIGQVRDPGLGAMIEVNGIRALVYGRRFEARIPLIQGANTLSATVATSMASVCRSKPVRITRTPLSP